MEFRGGAGLRRSGPQRWREHPVDVARQASEARLSGADLTRSSRHTVGVSDEPVASFDVPDPVTAAHEAGHAVAFILLGVRFHNVNLVADGSTRARVVFDPADVRDLDPLTLLFMAYTGLAGEELLTGGHTGFHMTGDWMAFEITKSVPQEIRDAMEFEQRLAGAQSILGRFEGALGAVAAELEIGLKNSVETIPYEDVLRVAEAHGAVAGAFPAPWPATPGH